MKIRSSPSLLRVLAITLAISLLLFCALAMSACGGESEQSKPQEGAGDVIRPEELAEHGGEQQEQGGEQTARELAEIQEEFHGQLEIYPGAIPDTSGTAAQVKEDAGADWVLRTNDNRENVVRFYDRELRRMRDLDKEETPSSVVYSFVDERGESASIEVVRAGPALQDGTYIIVTAGQPR
jgi:hypothetical protein